MIRKKNNANCYCMYFELQFPEDNDTVYLSLNYPYTFSRLNSLVSFIDNKYGTMIRKFPIGKSENDN